LHCHPQRSGRAVTFLPSLVRPIPQLLAPPAQRQCIAPAGTDSISIPVAGSVERHGGVLAANRRSAILKSSGSAAPFAKQHWRRHENEMAVHIGQPAGWRSNFGGNWAWTAFGAKNCRQATKAHPGIW